MAAKQDTLKLRVIPLYEWSEVRRRRVVVLCRVGPLNTKMPFCAESRPSPDRRRGRYDNPVVPPETTSPSTKLSRKNFTGRKSARQCRRKRRHAYPLAVALPLPRANADSSRPT